jgi:uncharacterized protein YbaP (TraB family)
VTGGLARLVTAGALLAWAVAVQADRPEPALWQVPGERNTVYLFGSVHLLRDGEFRLEGAIADAYEDAEAVFLEVDMDDLSPAQAAAATAALAIDSEGRGLFELMGPDAGVVRERAAAAGIDLTLLASVEPWFAGLTVVTLSLAREGFSAGAGVEQVVLQQAGADGKEVLGFETLEEQLGALDGLDVALQRDFLLKALDDAARPSEALAAFLEAWKNGDEGTLAQDLASEFGASPALYESLMVRRNQRWVEQIEELLDDDRDYLVVVGALHLVGPDGLPALLRDRGRVVTRR